MPIVPYNEAPQNHLAAPGHNRTEGAVAALDTDSGHIFDAKGNPIGKWEPLDEKEIVQQKSAQCAQYAANYAFTNACHAMSTGISFDGEDSRERAKAMMLAAGVADICNPVSRLDLGTGDVHIPSALPNIAMGYRNEPPMADMYSPIVQTPKPSDYYYVFDKSDAFQRAYPNGGAGGANVHEIAPRLSSTLFTTTERALGGFVSMQLEAAADAPLRILQATTKRVMNAMLLEREIRIQSLARNTSTWNASNVATLIATYQWNGGAASDPKKDVDNRLEASLGRITGMLMARPTFNAMLRNPAFRAFYGFKDSMGPVPAASELSTKFGWPTIFVSDMKYINASGVPAYVWGTDVVLFRQPEEMPPTSQDDIASSYSFRWNMQNKPIDAAMAAGGFIVRQYYVQDRGSLGGTKVVVLHQDAEVQTSAYVGGLIVGAYQ